jgi:hypothetical protein
VLGKAIWGMRHPKWFEEGITAAVKGAGDTEIKIHSGFIHWSTVRAWTFAIFGANGIPVRLSSCLTEMS